MIKMNKKLALYTVPDTTLILDGLDFHKKYYYRVKSLNISGESDYSEYRETQVFPNKPEVIVSNITDSTFSLTWGNIEQASEYRISVAVDADFVYPFPEYDELVITKDKDSIVIKGLSSGFRYYYRVASVYNLYSYVSSFTEGSAQTMTLPPYILEEENVRYSSFRANFSPRGVCHTYKFQLSLDEELNNSIDYLLTQETINLQDLSTSQIYFYCVKCINPSFSDNSPINTTLLRPFALEATNIGSNSFKAVWRKVNNADYYEVEVSKSSSFDEDKTITRINNIDDTTLLVKYSSYIDHYYRVSYSYKNKTSAKSNIVKASIYLEPPIALDPVNVSNNSFEAVWINSEDALYHDIIVSWDPHFSYALSDYNNVRQELVDNELNDDFLLRIKDTLLVEYVDTIDYQPKRLLYSLKSYGEVEEFIALDKEKNELGIVNYRINDFQLYYYDTIQNLIDNGLEKIVIPMNDLSIFPGTHSLVRNNNPVL